jgi:hypothetical protein
MPKPTKIQPLSNLLSPSILAVWGHLKYSSCAHAEEKDACAVLGGDSKILGSAALGEAVDAMVGFSFWALYRTFT